MAFTDPRTFFGIHSFTPYSRSTGIPYGEIRVLEEATLSLQGELSDLMGGSSKFAWASEDAGISAEVSLKGSQYDDFMFELFLGKAPTANNAETTGSVSTLTNKYGTSIMSASNGIASTGVTVTSADSGDLKFGRYVIKATGTALFDLYIKSDIDLARGNNGTVQSDLIKLTAAPLDVSTPAIIAELGLTFTKTGTPNFTTGDTAEFSVRPPNTKSMDVKIGGASDTTFPEFGAVVMAQKRGNQEMMEIDLFRCKAAGMPIGFSRNAWSKYEIKIKALYDSTLDGIFNLRHVTPSGT